MTEPHDHVTPVPDEVSAEGRDPNPNTYAAAPVAPARRPSRKAFALVAGVGAVAALVGGGVWASAALADADRDAPTAYWVPRSERYENPAEPGPVPANALSGKLLPVPSAFELGPDLAQDGNNFFVSGEKAVEGFKEARGGLSSSDRKKRDEALADLKLKGLAGRSYVRDGSYNVVEVRIMQADPAAVGKLSEVSKKFLEATGDDRDAPKVDGFPDAKCSLMAIGREEKEKIDSLDCVAVEGDVMITFRAYGAKPFSNSDAVQFFKNQLNHLKSPGESA
ncbi:hypothetical protein [Streptomyces sp. H34-S4]|uniref:hypothetical protein n=1 Tax=Streptomyces sp. H34-S4 TaxID=2996463 RepID=UPI00226E2C17|nr:hypothetical protein [Streptomyces sp. H34-S4]MCY0934772.1 hypothetical protein [Streptomyces sp. H34-S4]